MPGDEPQANTSEVASTSSSTVTTEVQPLLPAGLAMPKPLKTEGNLASNWKKFKRAWENYAIVARLNRRQQRFYLASGKKPWKFSKAWISPRKTSEQNLILS